VYEHDEDMRVRIEDMVVFFGIDGQRKEPLSNEQRAQLAERRRTRAVLKQEYKSLLQEEARLLGIEFPLDSKHLLDQVEQGHLRGRGQGFRVSVSPAPHGGIMNDQCMYYQNTGWAAGFIARNADRSGWTVAPKMQVIASTIAANKDIDVFVLGEMPPMNPGGLAVSVCFSATPTCFYTVVCNFSTLTRADCPCWRDINKFAKAVAAAERLDFQWVGAPDSLESTLAFSKKDSGWTFKHVDDGVTKRGFTLGENKVR
jgi:hypothetical protein